MHIKKVLTPDSRLPSDIYFTMYHWQYAVHYKGFVASGPDLGACIAACHGAANQTV